VNCQEARDLLPLAAYDDLAAAEHAAVNSHLAQCPACRRELAALQQVRQLLDQASVPGASIVVPASAGFELRRQRRSTWRWRAAALIGLAAAVGFAAVRLELRFDNRQVVVRWGRFEPPPARVEPVPTPIIVHRETELSAGAHEQLRVLNELVHALAANLEAGDHGRREDLIKLRQELAAIRQIEDKRWSETRRDVSALYTAQFGARNSGENP
jgi:Putative zinc-finger